MNKNPSLLFQKNGLHIHSASTVPDFQLQVNSRLERILSDPGLKSIFFSTSPRNGAQVFSPNSISVSRASSKLTNCEEINTRTPIFLLLLSIFLIS